jgi:hypothetical protein
MLARAVATCRIVVGNRGADAAVIYSYMAVDQRHHHATNLGHHCEDERILMNALCG